MFKKYFSLFLSFLALIVVGNGVIFAAPVSNVSTYADYDSASSKQPDKDKLTIETPAPVQEDGVSVPDVVKVSIKKITFKGDILFPVKELDAVVQGFLKKDLTDL